MTFTTASGLLPAGNAVYVQRRPNGSSDWKRDIRLGCKALRLNAEQANPIENVQLGKLAVVKASLADFQSEPRRVIE